MFECEFSQEGNKTAQTIWFWTFMVLVAIMWIICAYFGFKLMIYLWGMYYAGTFISFLKFLGIYTLISIPVGIIGALVGYGVNLIGAGVSRLIGKYTKAVKVVNTKARAVRA